MQQYGLLDAFYKSFYSKAFYRDVAKYWQSSTFLFLFVLLLISWIPSVYQYQLIINYFNSPEVHSVVEQVPDITIAGGIVSSNKPEPLLLREAKSGELAAIIDTTGQYTSLENTNAHVLLTRNQLFIRKDKTDIKEYDLSKMRDMTLNHKTLLRILNNATLWLYLAIFPAMVLVSLIYRVLQMLIYGLIGKMLAILTNVELNYKQCMRLSIMAMTPAIVLATIVDFFSFTYQYQYLSYFVISMLYLFFGVTVNEANKQR